jgi:heme exporter protein A
MATSSTQVSAAGAADQRHEAAIEVTDLVRRFGERVALAGVSVTLRRGQTLAVFGPNGAGKTTLLRVLSTLLLPHSGSVRVLGQEIPRNAHAVRDRIGMLGHEPLLYRDLTGRENLSFYARLYDVTDPDQRIEEVLAATGMTGRADDRVADLSRGMVQRLAICRAVLHRPALLLLDEPTAGLDPEAAELVEPLVGHASGTTRVLVTHDLVQGLAEADTVLGLRGGVTLLHGDASSIDRQRVRSLYEGAGLPEGAGLR